MGRLNELKNKIQKRINNKELIQKQLEELKTNYKEKSELLHNKEKAMEIVKKVALETQSQLEYHLSDMVSTGLNTVFDEEYGFRLIFEEKSGKTGGKTECNLFFEKKGHLVDPLNFSGLGESDIAAFCLRCAAWSMDKRYRNVLILDEPLKHLSVNHHEKAGEMIKLLSKELNLQIIMVTHSERFTSYADKIFKVQMNNKGISKVITIKGE